MASNVGGDNLRTTLDELIAGYDLHDPPFISDALAKINSGGFYLLKRLGEMWEDRNLKHHVWIIKILCDEWGNTPKVGDVIRRYISRNLRNSDGNLILNKDRNASIAAGTEREDFYYSREFVVDEKGCIRCEFDDAMYFLNVHGIHSRSKRALNPQYTKAKSREPVVDRNDGQSKYVYYHRHMEVDKEQYAALPLIGDAVEEKPRRRRNRNNESAPEDTGAEMTPDMESTE
jgi:hypothetical protein